MTQYTEYETSSGQMYVIKIDDNGIQSSIPNDPANSDYQAYLNRDNPDWGKPPTLQGDSQ